jgi:hypothetical protein
MFRSSLRRFCVPRSNFADRVSQSHDMTAGSLSSPYARRYDVYSRESAYRAQLQRYGAHRQQFKEASSGASGLISAKDAAWPIRKTPRQQHHQNEKLDMEFALAELSAPGKKK